MTAHASSGPILEVFPVLFWSWMTNVYERFWSGGPNPRGTRSAVTPASISPRPLHVITAKKARIGTSNMISIELWRARIGRFNCSRQSRSISLSSNLQQQTTHGLFSSPTAGGGGLFSLCRSLLIRRALTLMLVAVITHLLLSAGDVERNPGPIYRGWYCTTATRMQGDHVTHIVPPYRC